jgi:hypothetical protein
MANGTAATAKDDGGKKASVSDPLSTMLRFLKDVFPTLGPWARTLIAILIAFAVVGYVFHGLIGPTYVKGKLFFRDEADGAKQYAKAWKVRYGNEEMTTNDNGSWMLPVVRGGIPGRIGIEVERDGRLIDEYITSGPWPIYSALWPMDLRLVVDLYKPQGERITKIAENSSSARVCLALRQFLPVFSVAAQAKPAAPAKRSPGASPPARSPVAGTGGVPAAPQAPFDYGIVLKSVEVEKFPGFFQSGGQVYFTVHLGDKELSSVELLYGAKRLAVGETAVWELAGSDARYTARFPVKSEKESWIPVEPGKKEKYKGLIINVSDAVVIDTSTPSKPKVSPKARVYLKMWEGSGAFLGSFEMTEALKQPDDTKKLTATTGSGKASVEIKPVLGRLTITRPLY